MKKDITKGLEGDQKQEMEEYFNNALHFRKRLDTVLNEKKDGRIKLMYDEKKFESPSWSEEQAYNIGYVRALEMVRSLLF